MTGIIEIDPSRSRDWDEFVAAHPRGQIYHLSGWKTVLETCFPHIRGHLLAAVEGPGHRIAAGLPIYEVRSWLLGTRLISSPFATISDPLTDGPAGLAPLIERAKGIAEANKARAIEIRASEAGPCFEGSGFGEARYYVHHVIDLSLPLDALWKRFHRSCVRQRIARAGSSGIEIRPGRDRSDLRVFHGLLAMTRRRRSLPAQPYRFLEALWSVFSPDGRIRLLLAEREGRAAAGLLLLVFRDRVTAELLGSDDSFNAASPVHALFWSAIQWAHGEGYRIFDLGRTSPANSSLLEFKGHWGASAKELPQFFYPPSLASGVSGFETSWKYRLAKAMTSPKVPRPVYDRMGSLIYRHLG